MTPLAPGDRVHMPDGRSGILRKPGDDGDSCYWLVALDDGMTLVWVHEYSLFRQEADEPVIVQGESV